MWWIKYQVVQEMRKAKHCCLHLTWWCDTGGLIRPQRTDYWLAAAATRWCTACFFLQEDLCCLWQLQLVQLLLQEMLDRQIHERKDDTSVRVPKLEEKAFCTEILLPESSWRSCASKANVENSWPTLISSVWSIQSSYAQCQQKGNTLVLPSLEIKGSLNLLGMTLKWVL